MRTTILGAGLLFCCLFIIPAYAQSPAQLVKNALAVDESGADADHAIQLYRQVVATPSDQSVYAAFAQFRIAQLTLRKGSLTAAALEFGKLAGDYGDYSDLVGVLLAEDRFDVFHSGSGQAAARRLSNLPTAPNGMYRHPRTGVELNPEGWVVGNVVPSSGGGEIVQLSAQGSGAPVMVWLRSDHLAAADIPGRLRGTLQQKILQRLDFEGYRMRPDSIQPHLIAGKQALSAVADFTDNGQPMAECLTLIFSENTRVLFFSRIPASQLTDFKPRFDKLAATAVLPQAVAAR